MAEPALRGQHPAISPDGKVLCVSWQGDLWLMPVAGGRPARITIHPAQDQNPVWTRDGKTIVFASRRYGNYDVFSVGANGSNLKRLTFDSGDEYPTDSSPDGRWVVGHTTSIGSFNVFAVSSKGGDLVPLTSHPMERSHSPAFRPDGASLVYCGNGAPGWWRKALLKGSNAAQLWQARFGPSGLSSHVRMTKEEFNDLFPKVAQDGSVTFVSNRSGSPNMWRLAANGGLSQLTKFGAGETIRWPSISRDGRHVVFEKASRLFHLEGGRVREIVFDPPADERTNPVVDLSLTSGVSGFAVSPDGKRVALSVRGDIYLAGERGGITRRLTTHPARDDQPVWLDKDRILFVTGRDGRRRAMVVDAQGRETAFLPDLQEDFACPSVSPDGKHLAFHVGLDRIAVVPVSGGAMRTVVKGNFYGALRGGEASFSWSPDSAWLAVRQYRQLSLDVDLHPLAGGAPVRAARVLLRPNTDASTTPRFLPNGKAIYFVADQFDRPELFVVDLMPAAPSFPEDDLDLVQAKAAEPAKVEVFATDLDMRLRRLTTSATGVSTPIASADGRTIWAMVDGQWSAVPVSGGSPTPVAGLTGRFSEAALAPGGSKLWLLGSGRLTTVALPQGANSPWSFVAEARIDLRAEQAALFEEIGWALDRLYYDPKMHGKDWAAIQRRYAALVPHAYDRADFYALMLEMLEELDSSHLSATAPPEGVAGADATGYLGVEWDVAELLQGRHVVARVLPLAAAAQPWCRLEPGDRLLAMDSKPLAGASLALALNRKAGRRVALTVERKGARLEMFTRPDEPSVRDDREYEDWVARNRREVAHLSSGHLAYIHVRRMDSGSYSRFLQEIRTEVEGKKGVVFDVRFNGGGNTAHELLGVLVKTPWAVRTIRSAPGATSENAFRGDALELPSALLVNAGSASNAEMLAEGFRRLKIGPIVGEPTAGAVIGTSGLTLWDGGSVGIPALGAYSVTGENLEGTGRMPDYRMPYDPNGPDRQLERAVSVLLGKIGE